MKTIRDLANDLIQQGIEDGYITPLDTKTRQRNCNHEWQYRRDWGGDPAITNGTFDASYWYCSLCEDETDEEPDGWQEPFAVPEYDEFY